jgi:hopanoid biosynthesis associated protein HpnK
LILAFTADDFGLSPAINEAVELAHREGVLTAASLMVAGPAATDAVARARRLPGLRVGLHLVAIEGPPVSAPDTIPGLLDPSGAFPSGQLRLGLRYFFRPPVRRQLAAEMRAQFAAFAATGLTLAHADAHKHMHLHPTVGRLLIEIGRGYGLNRVRVPAEPPNVMAALGETPGVAARVLYSWSRLLRKQVARAGMQTTDHCFGLAWTGQMTAERLRRLLSHLPRGTSEIYFHPSTSRDASLRALMPAYDHAAELAALLDPEVRRLASTRGAAIR